jgi:hypothetical protein
MKKILTFILLCVSTLTFAQKSYSYITDRKFSDPEDLLGYNFRPSMREIKDAGKTNIAPGAVGFGVTQNNLYVEGDGIQGVYNLNNINPTEYGFKLNFMNARDATIQGHLKVIVGKNQYPQAVIFLRSNKEKEIIYYLPEVPKDLFEKERKYFTDKNEQVFIHQDSIYGKTLRPFFIYHQEKHTQERLEMKDSCSIKFIEKVTIIDKTKKKDKESVAKDSIAALAAAEKGAPMPKKANDKDDKKNIKIIKEHFMVLRQILKFPDGTTEDKTMELLIKNSSLKEDKSIDFEGDRYLLLLDTNKGEVSIYLNGNKMVNSIEGLGKLYYVRGF